MCSANDDPSTYDRMQAEQVRRAAITRDGTQLDTTPGSAAWVSQQPGYLPTPGESVRQAGARPDEVHPSWVLSRGAHVHTNLPDTAETWLGMGWLLTSLWERDPDADLYDAQMDLIPFLNHSFDWITCRELLRSGIFHCNTPMPSSFALLCHLNEDHHYSSTMLADWLRRHNEHPIRVPQKGDAVDVLDGRIE